MKHIEEDDEIANREKNDKKLFNSYLNDINKRVSSIKSNSASGNDEIDFEKLSAIHKRIIDVIKKNGVKRTWLNPKYELSYMIQRRDERLKLERLLNHGKEG